MSRVAIVGSRHWKDWRPIHRVIDGLDDGARVLSGDAPGADAIALQYAKDCSPRLTTNRFPAEWKRHGRSAGPRRNKDLAEACDWMVAFWNGKTEHSGTLDALTKTILLDKPAVLYWQR